MLKSTKSPYQPKPKKWVFFLLLILLFSLLSTTFLSAAGLKKVLILDFINIEKKGNFQYLESTITEAVQKALKDKFAFKETSKKEWLKVAKKNFIYRKDFYTQTAAMNLGLLAKQDIVISGGYRIVTKKRKILILTQVRILDISKRKVISEFTMKGKADNTIFDSVDKIAKKISVKAKDILPGKDEWAKKGIVDEEPGLPFMNNIAMGIRGGGEYYIFGLGDRLLAELPAISLILRGNLPFLWDRLALQLESTYIKETPKEDENPDLEGLTTNTLNYILGGFFVLDFNLTDTIGLHPKLGGGYVIQSTVVSGIRNEKFNNGIPFAGGGFDLSYMINDNLSIVFTLQNYTEFEENNITLLNIASIGINVLF